MAWAQCGAHRGLDRFRDSKGALPRVCLSDCELLQGDPGRRSGGGNGGEGERNAPGMAIGGAA
jgi:hypothetical protein